MPNSKNSDKKKPPPTARASRSKINVYVGSGNVFKDMGMSEDEAVNLFIRGKLMIEIKCTIRSRDWTQRQAAEVLGIAQPRIAELFAGRIDLFSIDTLIKYLTRLGKEVTLNVKDSDIVPMPVKDEQRSTKIQKRTAQMSAKPSKAFKRLADH